MNYKMLFYLSSVFMLFGCYSAIAATYYIRADGLALNREMATGPPSDKSRCMSVATHNAETFSPGDVIKISNKGGHITSQIIPPSSGSIIGGPITYTSAEGESAVIDANHRVTSWSYVGDGVYLGTTIGGGAWMVFEDGLPLRQATSSNCSDGKWFSNHTKLFYRPSSNSPDNHIVSYSRYGSERRGHIDLTANKNCYIVISSLIFRNGDGISAANTNANITDITVDSCTFLYGNIAVFFISSKGYGISNITYKNNVVYRWRSGFKCYGVNISNITATGNIIIDGGTIDGTNRWRLNNLFEDTEAFGHQRISNSTFSNNILIF